MAEAKVLIEIRNVDGVYQACLTEVDDFGAGSDPVAAMKDAFGVARSYAGASGIEYDNKIVALDVNIAAHEREIEKLKQMKANLIANHKEANFDVLELEKSPYLGAVYHGAMVIMPEVVCGIEKAWNIDFTSAKVVKTNLPPPSMPFRTDPQCRPFDPDKEENVIDVGTKKED